MPFKLTTFDVSIYPIRESADGRSYTWEAFSSPTHRTTIDATSFGELRDSIAQEIAQRLPFGPEACPADDGVTPRLGGRPALRVGVTMPRGVRKPAKFNVEFPNGSAGFFDFPERKAA